MSAYSIFSDTKSSHSGNVSASTEHPASPQQVSISLESVATVPQAPSTASFIIKLVIVLAVTTCIGCAGVAIVIVAESLRNTSGSTTVSVITGTLNYTAELTGNGYHGVYRIRYYSATIVSASMRFSYPIVYLSGTTFSGNYVNNAWYGSSSSCSSASLSSSSNSSGIATCTAVCKALSKTYVGVAPSCSTGYLGAVTNYVSPDRAVYTSVDATSSPWIDNGSATNCTSAMTYCDCTI